MTALGKRTFTQAAEQWEPESNTPNVKELLLENEPEAEIVFTDDEEEIDPLEAEKAFERLMAAAEADAQKSDEYSELEDEIKMTRWESKASTAASEITIKPEKKKREAKMVTKHVCTGCLGVFKQLVDTEIRLCYACVYIHQSVDQAVKRNNGSL